MTDTIVTMAMFYFARLVLFVIFDQSNNTATIDSSCSAILTKPPYFMFVCLYRVARSV